MSPALVDILGWIAWIAALAAIGGYVFAFLRNRPYLRPFNSLGLLLTGAALLAMPTRIAHAAEDASAGVTSYVVVVLTTAVLMQLVAALRRRRPRTERT